MKKWILLAVIVLFFAVLLIRLFLGPFSYEFIHKVDSWDDVRIEIVRVDDSENGIFETSSKVSESYSADKITLLAVVQDNRRFVEDLQQLKSYEPLGSPIYAVFGDMVRITFPDGDVELISSYGSALISGSHVNVYTKTFDKEEFDAFIARWLNLIY